MKHTLATKIEREIESSARRSCGIEGSGNILNPSSSECGFRIGCETQEEECESIEHKGNGEDVERFESAEDEPPANGSHEVDTSDKIELFG